MTAVVTQDGTGIDNASVEIPNRNITALPQEMQFTDVNLIVISIYANLLWISLVGNLIVFTTLVRRKKKSRVHVLLINLCTADMITTLVEMPLKIAWKTTVQWKGGDIVCRAVSCMRVFGLYLSALLLIAISVDRLLAIWDPLSSVQRAGERTRIMIFLAWILSIACAAPQAVIFHVLPHPLHPWYLQCVTFGSITSETTQIAYGLCITMLTYGLPLFTIFFCFLGIWLKMLLHSAVHHGHTSISNDGRSSATPSIRASNMDRLTKAKKRTLTMTCFIVTIFILCWSPYQIMSLWYLFDRNSAQLVDHLTQEILFIFGVSSSVLNPYVYGMYSMGIWRHVDVLASLPCLHGKFKRKRVNEVHNPASRSMIGDDDTFGNERSATMKRSANSRPHLNSMNSLTNSPRTRERKDLDHAFVLSKDMYEKDKILYL